MSIDQVGRPNITYIGTPSNTGNQNKNKIGQVKKGSNPIPSGNPSDSKTSNNTNDTDLSTRKVKTVSAGQYKEVGENLSKNGNDTSKIESKESDKQCLQDAIKEFLTEESPRLDNDNAPERPNNGAPLAIKSDLKWKTSLTEGFKIKESSHLQRLASVLVSWGDNLLKIISLPLEKITKKSSIFHVKQSVIPGLKELNSCEVINSQKKIGLANVDPDKREEIHFASDLAIYRFSSGAILSQKEDASKLKISDDLKQSIFSLDSLPNDVKENVKTFINQLDAGGFEFCSDGMIRTKKDDKTPRETGADGKIKGSAFEAKLGCDKRGKIFLSFSGTDVGHGRTGTIGTDVAHHFGLMDSVYKNAILLADMAKQCLSNDDGSCNKLVISGYSLGGGMAQLAAAVTGLPAVVVNPAPVNKTIWARTGLDEGQLKAANSMIYQVTLENDLFSEKMFSNSPESRSAQIGQKILLKPKDVGLSDKAGLFSHFGGAGLIDKIMTKEIEKLQSESPGLDNDSATERPNNDATASDPKWKTSLTEGFNFKESSHLQRLASVLVSWGDNLLKIISLPLEKITKKSSIFHVEQSVIPGLEKLNSYEVINSQKKIGLANVKPDKRNEIQFASASLCIMKSRIDCKKFSEITKEKSVLISYNSMGQLSEELGEKAFIFMSKLDEGGFELCKDGVIRQKDRPPGKYDHGPFEAMLAYDKRTKKIFLSFRGTSVRNHRNKTIISDIAQHFGLTDNMYKSAILLADMAKQCFGDDKLLVAGHSLGGGMAQLAAAVTGLSAVVVNPAPVNKTIWARTGLSKEQFDAANGRIYQLSVKDEIISDTMFSNSPESRSAQIGQKVVIDFPNENDKKSIIRRHSAPIVFDCLEENIDILKENELTVAT
ncbi:MAG: hypothetical protein LBH49_01065 [Puniceicoccales bacterium]|jgi:predicted esterase YcpF (UPF0227 family)|nr:hypothetical protein [Puniceicoccales bacterium]